MERFYVEHPERARDYDKETGGFNIFATVEVECHRDQCNSEIEDVRLLHINAATCYAIQLLTELATQKRQMSRTELSERTGIKHHFCQNILLRLKRAGLVESSRGIDGGFRLAEDPYEITLLDVVLKLEGLTLLSAFEYESPDGVPKGMYWELFAVQRDIERRLDEITIGHLSEIAGALLEATDKAAVTDQKPWRAHRPTGARQFYCAN